MATEYNILRDKMLAYFRRAKEGQLDLHGIIKPYFRGEGIELDATDFLRIEQIIHELYVAGIFVPGVKPRANLTTQSGTLIFPHYHVTEYGARVLSDTEYQPYDPDGYLARIKTQMPSVDPVIIRYLEECLSCFRGNLLLAAATMLGCAAERAILLLVEAFGRSLSELAEKQKYEKETEPFIISRKWKALWKRLAPLALGLPNGLGDDLGTILERVFDIIRTTRNDAGHPTGKTIEKETVHANLLLFPIFCKRVYGLIQHFSSP
jgi:hypothetical protein